MVMMMSRVKYKMYTRCGISSCSLMLGSFVNHPRQRPGGLPAKKRLNSEDKAEGEHTIILDNREYVFDVNPCMNERCKDEIVSGLGRGLYSLPQVTNGRNVAFAGKGKSGFIATHVACW